MDTYSYCDGIFMTHFPLQKHMFSAVPKYIIEIFDASGS
jgi:hypothetical protein